MDLRGILHRLMTTRYARELASEVAHLREEIKRERGENCRLRGENRALLNSILGIAGIPPVLVAQDAPELEAVNKSACESASQTRAVRKKGREASPPGRVQSRRCAGVRGIR